MSAPAITGRTRLVGVVADPVAQARAPGLANPMLREQGADAVLVPLHVAAGGLAGAVAGLRAMRNFAGAMVSMPHKQAILPLLDTVSPEARLVGAVNVVRRESDGRLSGHVLDGEGFVGGLRGAGHEVRGRDCLLVGAGGAASAIAYALARHGCASLTMLNRTRARADALADRLREAFPHLPVRTEEALGARYDLAVNGTCLGMQQHDSLPLDERQIRSARLVAECVLAPERTALLTRAAQLGIATHGGMHMLQAQMTAHLAYLGVLPAPTLPA